MAETTKGSRQIEQIKRNRDNEVQKIDLGWRGYIPGYKNKVADEIKRGNEESYSRFIENNEQMWHKQDPRRLDDSLKNEPQNDAVQQETNDVREEAIEAEELQAREIIQEARIEELENIEEEEMVMNEMAEEQELYQLRQQAERIYEQGQSYGHPSFFKYFVVLIPWAVAVDIVDTLDVDVMTWIGFIFARSFSILSWLSILFILWFTDGKLKSSRNYAESLESTISDLQKDIVLTTRYALKTSKYLRKVPGMKGVARQIPRTLVKIRKFARKNPLTKVIIGGALNIIPWLSIFNLLCVWVYLSYRDEKKSYKQAAEMAKEAYEQISSELA